MDTLSGWENNQEWAEERRRFGKCGGCGDCSVCHGLHVDQHEDSWGCVLCAEDVCRVCNAKGWIGDIVCVVCKGSGRKEV